MFEKSKSAITFKEFQDKMNTINNFENDWGYFYDPDTFIYNNTNTNTNTILKNALYRPKKRDQKSPLLEKIEKLEQKKIEEKFIDVEKQKQNQKEKHEEPETNKDNYNYNYKDNYLVNIVESITNCIQTSFIIFTMFYVIFKVV